MVQSLKYTRARWCTQKPLHASLTLTEKDFCKDKLVLSSRRRVQTGVSEAVGFCIVVYVLSHLGSLEIRTIQSRMDYERVLTVKPEVLVYRLPPRPSNRGYRAADWGLDKPSWTGRMRIVVVNNKLTIKLEDRAGELFAKAPIDSYPSVAVESVLDSSRYFVLRICDDSGRTAFIGIGFADRGDAFDFNVTLQDHFNSLKKDQEIEKSLATEKPLDLQLKEGQTFSINLGGKLGSKAATSKPRTNVGLGAGGILLPPPPGGASRPQVSIPPPQSSNPTSSLLGTSQSTPQPQQSNPFGQSDWGDFATAQASSTATNVASDPGWVQF